MKNISTHVAIAVVSLVLVIASAFLMTAPEAGMRLIGEYVTPVLGCGVHRCHHPARCCWSAAARRSTRTSPHTPPRNRKRRENTP